MEDALVRTSDESREIVSQFRRRIRALGHAHGDKIREKVSEHWIGWRSTRHGRTFAEMRPLQQRVQVFILPAKRSLKDPTRLAKPSPPTQGWNYFLSRFDVRTLDEVEAAFQLIRQSYERGANGHRGNGHRATVRRRQIV
jgi:predicted transport protein